MTHDSTGYEGIGPVGFGGDGGGEGEETGLEGAGERVVGGAEGNPAEPSEVGGTRKRRGKSLLRPHQKEQTAREKARMKGRGTLLLSEIDGADLADLTVEEQQYLENRLKGMAPTESMRAVDRASGNTRRQNAVKAAAYRLERRLKAHIRESARAEDMTDSQFFAWEKSRVERWLEEGGEGLAGRLAGLKFLEARREARRLANVEGLLESIRNCQDRLEQLNGIANDGAEHGIAGAVEGDG